MIKKDRIIYNIIFLLKKVNNYRVYKLCSVIIVALKEKSKKMKDKKAEKLIIKFIGKSISAEEIDRLSLWVEKPENEELFKDYIRINYALDYNLSNFNKEKSKIKILNRIDPIQTKSKVVRFSKSLKYAAAIAVLVLFSSPFIFKEVFVKTVETQATPILPGVEKAILTLENGNQITLEKGRKYTTEKVRSNGDNLVYSKKNTSKADNLAYNYLTIPKGGQFFVELSDGTKVWINSESKLKYPVSFKKGQPREVSLLYGEAYFDVTPSDNNDGSSFIVNTKEQDVTVLGTEFNIKAYKEDDSILTTLVEGRVNVTNGVFSKELTPGLQSNVNQKNESISVKKVDVTYETAWKNGYFMFDKETLGKMMTTLARWYDVEFVYEEESKKDIVFSGLLNRANSIEELLDNLEKTGEVEFEIENKRVLIK